MGGKDEKKEEIITAVYKLNLHCQECAHSVEKSILRTGGIHKVDIDVESGKVTVKGVFDPKKMHGWIAKKSKKKVEWISPKPKEKKVEWISPKLKEEKPKEKDKKKEEIIKTTLVKVHMHCERCEHDIKWKLQKLKGVHSVKTNRDTDICTVVGTLEEKEIIEYLRTRVHKHGVIVPPKLEKEKEKKEKEKEKEKDQKEEKKKKEVKEDKEESISVEVIKIEEIKKIDMVVPYFIHCTHAPQWFSDEDPNACIVM